MPRFSASTKGTETLTKGKADPEMSPSVWDQSSTSCQSTHSGWREGKMSWLILASDHWAASEECQVYDTEEVEDQDHLAQ